MKKAYWTSAGLLINSTVDSLQSTWQKWMKEKLKGMEFGNLSTRQRLYVKTQEHQVKLGQCPGSIFTVSYTVMGQISSSKWPLMTWQSKCVTTKMADREYRRLIPANKGWWTVHKAFKQFTRLPRYVSKVPSQNEQLLRVTLTQSYRFLDDRFRLTCSRSPATSERAECACATLLPVDRWQQEDGNQWTMTPVTANNANWELHALHREPLTVLQQIHAFSLDFPQLLSTSSDCSKMMTQNMDNLEASCTTEYS